MSRRKKKRAIENRAAAATVLSLGAMTFWSGVPSILDVLMGKKVKWPDPKKEQKRLLKMARKQAKLWRRMMYPPPIGRRKEKPDV